MTTQIVEVSTAFGLVTIAAAIEEGLLPPADRRILALSNNAPVPETAIEIAEVAGVPNLFDRFDDVYSYNAFIAPQHPSQWRPNGSDGPRIARHLQLAWRIPSLDDVHLIVESIQVPPALTLASVFSEARIDVYADGLMSYGPTRVDLPAAVGARIERLLHLDLVAGLRPVLLTEFEVPAVPITRKSFLSTIAELGWQPPLDGYPPKSVAIVLGQYLSALDLLSGEEEDELYADLVRTAGTAGFTTVVFKPHPTAPDQQADRVRAAAEQLGLDLIVAAEPALVECWYPHRAVGLVLGCFSTGLLTAGFFDHRVARGGTEAMVRRLRPFENSNRIPITIVDASLPALAAGATPPRAPEWLTELVRTVSYCMQPDLYPELRPMAERFLAQTLPTTARYVTRKRLTDLELPGRPAQVPVSFPRRIARRIRRRLRTLRT